MSKITLLDQSGSVIPPPSRLGIRVMFYIIILLLIALGAYWLLAQQIAALWLPHGSDAFQCCFVLVFALPFAAFLAAFRN